MNFKRKIKRAKLPKIPHHCGTPMLYKDSYKVWICQECGKVKGDKDEQTRLCTKESYPDGK